MAVLVLVEVGVDVWVVVGDVEHRFTDSVEYIQPENVSAAAVSHTSC
jgi:hypothetical protein